MARMPERSQGKIIHARGADPAGLTVCGKNARMLVIANEEAIAAEFPDEKITCPACREKLDWRRAI